MLHSATLIGKNNKNAWNWLEPSHESLQRMHVKEDLNCSQKSLTFLFLKGPQHGINCFSTTLSCIPRPVFMLWWNWGIIYVFCSIRRFFHKFMSVIRCKLQVVNSSSTFKIAHCLGDQNDFLKFLRYCCHGVAIDSFLLS